MLTPERDHPVHDQDPVPGAGAPRRHRLFPCRTWGERNPYLDRRVARPARYRRSAITLDRHITTRTITPKTNHINNTPGDISRPFIYRFGHRKYLPRWG